MRVSLAVPFYNEEEILQELVRRAGRVLDALPGGPHQMVLVDDGSTDHTGRLLEKEAEQDPRIVLVLLSRNFGHQAALSAALDFVDGDVTVVLDGDLQDPPEIIPTLLDKHHEGFDVVYAQRRKRKEGLALRAAYFLYYRVLQRLAEVPIPVDAGDCALLSRRVVEHLRRSPERQRFIRGMRSWIGFRQVGVPVERSARHAGRSKYTPGKLLRLASDGVLAFSIAPIRAAAILGLLAILLSGGYTTYAVAVKLASGATPPGFTATTVLIAFSSGVQLLFLGVIGEYVGRVYDEVKRRPVYIVDRVVRHSAPASAPTPASPPPL